MAFDPDAYLANGSQDFNPDAWLASNGPTSSTGSSTDDPNAFMWEPSAGENKYIGNAIGAATDVAKGVPGFVEKLPQYAYRGYELAAGTPEQRMQALASAAQESIPMGQQMAHGLQSPVGSRGWDEAAIQALLMAAPAKELVGGVHPDIPVEATGERPPIQAPVPESELIDQIRKAQAQAPEGPAIAPESPVSRPVGKVESRAASIQDLQPDQPQVTIPAEDAKYAGTDEPLQASDAQAEQRDTAPVESTDMGSPEADRAGAVERPGSGTSNRAFTETYGEEQIPGGTGVDTTQLLDNARADIRSGAVDPYNVLSRTRAEGIANPKEYAALAAEHERLVNDAVAKQKSGTPDAQEAVQKAEDFANAIQPHKTAASDLMRLFQGDVNYDMSTPFGMDQYMKAEIGRGMKPAERPKFESMSRDIGQAQSDVQQAVARSDARVQSKYARVRDISIEEAAARVKQFLSDCIV